MMSREAFGPQQAVVREGREVGGVSVRSLKGDGVEGADDGVVDYCRSGGGGGEGGVLGLGVLD